MATNENLIPIPGRLHSVAIEGHVAGADEIYDDTKGKDQASINADVDTAIGSDSTANSIKGRIKSLETAVGEGSVATQIDNKINALDATKSQTAGADGLALSITEENGKITSISGSIAANTYDAHGAASTVKSELLGDAAADYNTLGKLEDKIQAEATTRGNADTALDGRLDAVEEVIPSAATSSNQLADKNFVNSSVATATATFRGTSNSGLTELEFLAWANAITTKDNNDYVFWNTVDTAGNVLFKKYKYDGTSWSYEYTLNNSSFTSDQWTAINSGLTSNDKTKLTALPTNAELELALAGKQAVINDLNDIRSGAALGATAYQKPDTGIPSTDLSSDVQASLGAADTAVQPEDLATIATTGSYNDLLDKPSIPSGLVQSDWELTNSNEVDFIKNKPTIPVVPTNVSAFTNDAGYLTQHQSIAGKENLIGKGVCSTAASTAAKEVEVSSDWILQEDALIVVKFTNAVSVANATLTVNSEQPKPIYDKGAALDAHTITAGTEVLLKYDGTNFNIIGGTGGGGDYNAALVGDYSGTATYPSFDPYIDTVHTKALTLTDVQKAQALANIGASEKYTVIKVSDLTVDSTFIKNSLIPLDGKIYRATTDTNNFPFPVVIDDNDKLVIDTINGKSALTISSDTLDSDWELFIDCSNDYNIEETVSKVNLRTDNIVAASASQANTNLYATTSRVRKTDFNLNDLKKAVADQNLEKYGLKVGDQKTINGHTYVIAGLNPMKGTTTSYRVTTNHVGLIVIPHTTQAWNASGLTTQGSDGRGGGYMNCDLHYYLKNTLLPLVESDLGASSLIGHSKLLSSTVTSGDASNVTGINRYGNATGCSSYFGWEENCKICALSEVQVYGATVWSSSGHDTGEACRQLDVFQRYSHTELFGGEYVWLRDVVSASFAARAGDRGDARLDYASYASYVAALVLFH